MSASGNLADPAVPAVASLMGEDAAELLAAVLATAGGRVRRHSISQVRYVPSRSITVQFRVEVVWESGKPSREVMVAVSGIDVPAEIPVFAADGMEVAVWRYPNDPFLPGLSAVHTPAGATEVLAQLGAPTDTVRIRTRAYRAGRRAVLEVTTPDARVFLKVVRPARAAALHHVHRRLASHVPVPHSLGWSEDLGVLALQALPGRTLRKAIESHSRSLPEPRSILDLLDRFPRTDASTVAVDGPTSRVAEFAGLLTAVSPSLGPRVGALVDRLGRDGSKGSEWVHGDFHASQILIDKAGVVGLVDVDTSGVGHRVDDLATLLGQLTTLSLGSPARRQIDRYGAALIAAFDEIVDPVELRLRTAAAVLGLATGPFRVQDRHWTADTEERVALAERWVRSADDLSA